MSARSSSPPAVTAASDRPGAAAAVAAAAATAPTGRDGQDRVFHHVRDRILDGRFPAGYPLRAQELAEATGLSRTPVREALSRLVQEGLVVRSGGWGFTVRTLELRDVLDLFRVREPLEVESARAAAARLDAETIAQLDDLLERSAHLLAAGEEVESILAARRFHLAISEASGNRLLLQMLQSINDRIHLVGLSVVRAVPGRAREVLTENRRILAALIDRDEAGLEAAVRHHIRRAQELFMGQGQALGHSHGQSQGHAEGLDRH